MAKCQRPAWTCCFFVCWILIAPGAVLTHWGLVESIPWMKDLPDNIEKGLEETFKFKDLKGDTQRVKDEAVKALVKCGVVADVSCAGQNYVITPANRQVNVAAERGTIDGIFTVTLNTVTTVANDKYFGVDSLNDTATSLNEMQVEFRKLQDDMPCQAAAPAFCELYMESHQIVNGYADVEKAIHDFTHGEIVTRYKDYSDFLVYLHALPYILVVGLLCFSLFWLRGGVCCCCKGGTPLGVCTIPFLILWLLSFILYFVICVIGTAVVYLADRFEVTVMKGKPTLEEVLEHIQTQYPEFWKVVFEDMEDGLNSLWVASWFFTATNLIIIFYTCCECMCCPYRNDDKAEG